MDPHTASPALHMLAFRLGDETVAMDILCVREVLDPGDITRIPQMPDYFLGVINLRGYAVPVIDLRHKLGMGRVAHTPATRIVILDLPGAGELQLMGVFADSVRGVVEGRHRPAASSAVHGGGCSAALSAGHRAHRQPLRARARPRTPSHDG